MRGDNDEVTSDWVRYWRSPDRPLEAMYAHFERHVYHRHSHESYSFGVTEQGAQAFTCRGGAHTSAAGMVMAFNPDDPHDGHAADDLGFTYRMIHIGPELVTGVLADIAERRVRRPAPACPARRAARRRDGVAPRRAAHRDSLRARSAGGGTGGPGEIGGPVRLAGAVRAAQGRGPGGRRRPAADPRLVPRGHLRRVARRRHG